jgi:hypothetical protein
MGAKYYCDRCNKDMTGVEVGGEYWIPDYTRSHITIDQHVDNICAECCIHIIKETIIREKGKV